MYEGRMTPRPIGLGVENVGIAFHGPPDVLHRLEAVVSA
jgi:hypothetical protein